MAIQFKSSTGFDYVSAANPLPVTLTGAGTMTASTIDAGTGTLPPLITAAQFRLGQPNDVANGIQADSYGSGTGLQILARRSGGTRASPSATPNGSVIYDVLAYGYTDALRTSPSARYRTVAKSLWSASNAETQHIWSATPSGSTTSADIMTLDSVGLSVTGTLTSSGLFGCGGSTPASASASGTAGTITWDSSYIYVCTATNTWKRVAIATW